MKRLVARLARAITRRRPIPEPVCWCGIHHLGVGYVHEPPPTALMRTGTWAGPITGVWWSPDTPPPTSAELDAGIRLDHPIKETR